MAKPFRRRTISSVSRAYSTDPLERIAFIGGVHSDHTRWSLSQTAAIALIEQGSDEFFFSVGDQSVRVVVLARGGEKYLQSEREKTHPDDLLNLAALGSSAATQAAVPPAAARRPRRLASVTPFTRAGSVR
ncbi:MAG: DUF3892 domain-containing protein [Verrucomicrobiota bacterium]